MDTTIQIQQVADIAEYAAMHGIPYNAAFGVFALIGSAGLRKIINRGASGSPPREPTAGELKTVYDELMRRRCAIVYTPWQRVSRACANPLLVYLGAVGFGAVCATIAWGVVG